SAMKGRQPNFPVVNKNSTLISRADIPEPPRRQEREDETVMLDLPINQDNLVTHNSRRQSLRYLWTFLLVLGIYFLLAFYRIGQQSLWLDEILSLRNARIDEPLFSSSVWWQYHGPLYFVLLHLWVKLGTSEAVLRSLSVLIGGVAVCLTYATALKLFNTRLA